MSSPLSIIGSNFYRSDGSQFFIKGVVYSTEASVSNGLGDVLALPDQCAQDARVMSQLRVNTIRVYGANVTRNHDECMATFAKNGIYVFLGLETPLTGINRATPEWTSETYEAYTKVVDAFSKYSNLAGFFLGNEVVNDAADSIGAIPYLKAAISDLKNYRDSKPARRVPIGSSLADVPSSRKNQQLYLACDDTGGASTLDFVGLHNYAWCGGSSFSQSGLDKVLEETQEYSIPVFLSETGCNSIKRTFSDQAAIFGPQMNSRFSGAIIYEWAEHINKYGLVEYNDADVRESFSTATPKSDFYTLSSQWATLNPTGKPSSAYTPTTKVPDCPAYTAGVSTGWTISPGGSLPTLALKLVSTPASETSTTNTLRGLPTLSTTGAAGISSNTGTSGAGADSQNSNVGSNNNNNGSSKSNGTTIGIGVGVGVAAVLLIAFLVWFLLRRRNSRRADSKADLDPASGLEVAGPDTYPSKPELDAYGTAAMVEKKYPGRSNVEISELGSNNQRLERDSTAQRSELPSEILATSGGVAKLGRKPLAKHDPALKEQTSPSSTNASNTPWHDEGREEFSPRFTQPDPQIHGDRERAASALAHAQAQSNLNTDASEVARLEEEERRLDREIAESERLRNLQLERERVRKLLEEKRKLAGGGG